MSGIRVKETMEQIHMPEEMQEQIIQNIQDRMEAKRFIEKERSVGSGRIRMQKGKWKRNQKENLPGNEKTFWMKKAAAAAVIVLTAGIVGIPVQGVVRSFVAARMEKIPEAELKDIVRIVYEREAEADSFSREFSDSENARWKTLLQAYGDGIFPERTICLVERGEEMPEGILCYVIQTGYFNLPEREMTDEELLQMIDFNKVRNYALARTPAGQEACREQQARQEELKRRVAEEGGIGREEAETIAAARMKSQLGVQAKGTKYSYVYLEDISKTDYAHKSDVAYIIVLQPAKGGVPYVCRIDAADGSILEAGENLPYARNILDE